MLQINKVGMSNNHITSSVVPKYTCNPAQLTFSVKNFYPVFHITTVSHCHIHHVTRDQQDHHNLDTC